MDKLDALWTKLARLVLFWLVWLWLFAVLDVIDFHVCIRDAGHCKIIDPTEQHS